jgi:hypothetical protein
MSMLYTLKAVLLAGILFTLSALTPQNEANDLTGAWHWQNGTEEQVLLLADGYLSHTIYNKAEKKFIRTRGGTYHLRGNDLTIKWEFDTGLKDAIGQSAAYGVTLNKEGLLIDLNGKKGPWKKLDNATENLSGLWHITARMQNGVIVPIHQTGPRKTVKLLTATRFQWAAINPETKEFFGTGGGTYRFKNGKYTEHIEFFSRDSSRVGASLSFDGSLQEGAWHHSGLSSRGDKIYEVWSRVK